MHALIHLESSVRTLRRCAERKIAHAIWQFYCQICRKRREFFEFATRKVLAKASTESPRCECAWAMKMF